MLDLPFLEIAGRRVSIDMPPYVIAELSANHNGDLTRAIRLIDEAKKCGADAVKLQTYTADTLTVDGDTEEFKIRQGLWKGKTLYQLYKDAQMPWDWHLPLFEHARKIDITIFSTPFDRTAVDLLEELNTPAYKIASFEITDLPLIEYVAKTKKPIIISTGLANVHQIEEAIGAARAGGCEQIALLHCVSGYPAPVEDYNLRTLSDMISRFGVVTGLSDHTLDSTTAIASIALGAAIIEKHFTLSRAGGGPDDSFSAEPSDLLALCKSANAAWSAMGTIDYGLKSSEEANLSFQRSLYFIKNMGAGELIRADCVKSIRPGRGLAPKFLDQIIGKRVRKDVKANTPVTLDSVDSDLKWQK